MIFSEFESSEVWLLLFAVISFFCSILCMLFCIYFKILKVKTKKAALLGIFVVILGFIVMFLIVHIALTRKAEKVRKCL